MEELGSADAFDRLGTIGIEEEYFVVDGRGRPVSATDTLVYDAEPPALLEGCLDHELFKFIIETQTPTIESPGEAADTVSAVREALLAHADEHGFRIAAAGLHPLAKWRELEHAEKPRYRSQLDRIQYPQHRNTTAGVHVHVGVDDADKAVWVANEARWYMPVILALSANSPFWNGFDTGLASARAKIFEGLPNTGMPTTFESFEKFAAFERLMVEAGGIEDRGELWFDVRPHSEYGTVEVRVPDAQSNPDVVVAFVEYAHALVLDLAARYADASDPWSGAVRRNHRREVLDENKWRAIRYGHEAEFVAPSMDGRVSLEEVVDRECERLGVSGIREVFEAESGAARQRRLRRTEGVDVLCESLCLDGDL